MLLHEVKVGTLKWFLRPCWAKILLESREAIELSCQKFWSGVKIGPSGPKLAAKIGHPCQKWFVYMCVLRSQVLQKLNNRRHQQGVVIKRKQQAFDVLNEAYTREQERRRNRLPHRGVHLYLLRRGIADVNLYYILRFQHTVLRGEMERDLLCGLKFGSENFSHGINNTLSLYMNFVGLSVIQ